MRSEHLLWLSDVMQGLLDQDRDDGFNVGRVRR